MNSESKALLKRAQEFYRGKHVLIPGGAGFIGSRLTGRLSGLGAAVTVVDPLDKHCGGNLFNLDPCLMDIRLIRQKIETFVHKGTLKDFSCIFNCVGMSDHHLGLIRPDMDYRINCQSGMVLLQKLGESPNSVRIVSLGSRSQYGRGVSPLVESNPLQPLDIQSVHKTALEGYHKIYGEAFGVDFLYLRLTNTYGPGQRMREGGIGFVGEVIRDSLEEKKAVIYGSLDRVKDLLYVDDVIEALLLAGMMKRIAGRIFNLGGRPCRVGELIRCIKEKVPEMKVELQPFPEYIKNIDAGDAVLNSDRFSSATGWLPKTPLGEGISHMIDYYRANKRYYW